MNDPAGYRLGAFVAETPIARGATSVVWRGRHAVQGLPVAIKVLIAERARDPRYREAFTAEVQAVARLSHPGIVMVFDHGVVGEGVPFTPGCPYLVTALADAGTLEAAPRPLP